MKALRTKRLADTLCSVKWRNFKFVMDGQRTLADPAIKLATPHVTNLVVDPKERKAYDLPYLHSWRAVHFGKILMDFAASANREPPIRAGAPLDFVPGRA